MASKTGKVGFVGGMDIPLIRNFQFGYEQGVKHASGSASVLANYTGTAPAAWNDPARGVQSLIGQFDPGAAASTAPPEPRPGRAAGRGRRGKLGDRR